MPHATHSKVGGLLRLLLLLELFSLLLLLLLTSGMLP
jgi:hypothetical protein